MTKNSKKPKVVSEWSHNDVFKLIACVRRQPTLWNAQHKLHRNKQERSKLWKEISVNDFKSKFGGNELLAKWSNIRIQFNSYANRKQQTNGAAAVKWIYFAAMQFIKNDSAASNDNEHDNEQTDFKMEPNFANSESSNESMSFTKTLQQSIISQPVSNARNERLSTSSLARAAYVSNDDENNQVDVDPLNQTTTKECEFELFAKYLASELRSLNNIAMARRIKRNLNRCFLDELDAELALS